MTICLKVTGLSLMEVLVSLLLISLILFGLDAAALYAMKETKIAWFYSVAENQLNNAIERLVALKNNDGLEEQLNNWNRENKIVLPLGAGTITGSFPNYNIAIFWGKISHRCQKQKLGSSGCLSEKIVLESH